MRNLLIFIAIMNVFLIIYLYGSILKKKTITKMFCLILLMCFFIYTFFTYKGSLRFSMFLTSKKIVPSYTTKIQESYSRGNEYKYFKPGDKIIIKNGDMLDFECREYFYFKTCTYYGN